MSTKVESTKNPKYFTLSIQAVLAKRKAVSR
jgi:hypothetical protein